MTQSMPAGLVSFEPAFLYIFNDSKTCDKEGFEFEIKDLITSQIFETLVVLAWGNFTVPFLPHGELGLTINAIRLNDFLWRRRPLAFLTG